MRLSQLMLRPHGYDDGVVGVAPLRLPRCPRDDDGVLNHRNDR
ncbi:MAG: hypothetical protein RI591_07290 [Dehalococcoidia bacterium]|nr:hypothetical protein [Dehalococcoidia bacterium]